MPPAKRYFHQRPSTSGHIGERAKHDPRRTFPKKGTGGYGGGNKQYGDPFEEKTPIEPEKLEKYSWGERMKLAGIKTKFARGVMEQKRKKFEKSTEQAARSEFLLHEDVGFIEPDEGKETYQVTQKEICDSVDITSATKYFELDLPKFGPYRLCYTKNGRHLLIGGRRGHVAAFDWLTKKLHCEINVMESVRDVQWLHVETMFAVAQKGWTYIYDSQGVELHCLKTLYDVQRLEFLPYHFLLVACTGTSFLHWLDVSMGKLVKSFRTKEGSLSVMCQNPANAIIHCGHAKGTVTLWSPNVQEPLVKMLCHPCPVKGVTVDTSGHYMATTGMDSHVRIWDLRQYAQVNSVKIRTVALGDVRFSERKLVAVANGTEVQIYKGLCGSDPVDKPYLIHECRNMVTDLKYCPYEDVLGVGHQAGFTSLLVPGETCFSIENEQPQAKDSRKVMQATELQACTLWLRSTAKDGRLMKVDGLYVAGAGEPNIDALEANPYQTRKQRREYEVKALLDKVQPEMISLDNRVLTEVDTETLEVKLEERAKLLYLKPEKIDFKPKQKRDKSVYKLREHVYSSRELFISGLGWAQAKQTSRFVRKLFMSG